jgi:cysteine-rich repeat protein
MYHSISLERKGRAVPMAFAALTVLVASSVSAQSDPLKCRQAVSSASLKYESARTAALQKCAEAKAKGKLGVNVACGAAAPGGDQKTFDKIAGAQTKLQASIAKACCGKDKTCGAGSGANADLALANFGWAGRVPACDVGLRDGLSCQTNADCPGICVGGTLPGIGCSTSAVCAGGGTCNLSNGCGANGRSVDRCPNFESGLCNQPLTHPGTVAECIACANDAAGDQLLGLLYGSLAPKNSDKGLEKCKLAIGKNGAKYFAAKRKALQGCEKGAIKNDLPPGSCPDAKAAEKISGARDKLLAAIGKACGGGDKVFGGSGANADIEPSAIGASLSCPAITPPGGTPCGGFISTAQDLANCVACVVDYKSTCGDLLGAPSAGPYPSASTCNPLCGNRKIDAGETCDDGNVVDGDGCPGNCVISTCSGISGSATVSVAFTPPAGQSVSALSVYLDYPDAALSIPGSGASPLVENRISVVPFDVTFTPNDLNYALRLVLQESNQAAITSGPLVDVLFDRCTGAPLPAPGAFNCRVESAAGLAPSVASVPGVTCAVTSVTP